MSADSRRMCKACFAYDGRWALAVKDGHAGRQVCENHDALYSILDQWTEAHWDPRTVGWGPLAIDCTCGCVHDIVENVTACHDGVVKTRLEWVEMWALELFATVESGDGIKAIIAVTDMAQQVVAYKRLLVNAD